MREFLLKVLKAQGIEGEQADKIIKAVESQADTDGQTIVFDDKKNPTYIPKARLDAEIEKRKNAQTQLDNANTTIKELEKTVKDNEEAVKSLETYKTKSQELETQIKATEKSNKMKDFIGKFERQPHNVDDLIKYIDQEAVKVSDDGVVGLKEQLENLVTGKEYLFKPVEGGTGNTGTKGKGGKGEDFSIGAELAKQRQGGEKTIADQRAEFFK